MIWKTSAIAMHYLNVRGNCRSALQDLGLRRRIDLRNMV
jgi:hypothetical protein